MSKTIGVLALVTATTVLSFVSVVARDGRGLVKDDWQPLTNEPSRAALFRQITADAKKASEAAGEIFEPFAFLGPFMFPRHTQYDDTTKQPRTGAIFGIDISHYEGPKFKFDDLKQQGVRFVYAKATQGVAFKDARFAEYWGALGALPPEDKVARGAYHFLSSSGDGVAQADRFLSFLELNGGLRPTDMPPVLDLEWDRATAKAPDRWQSRNANDIVETALAWLNRVHERTKKTPILYTSRTWWRERAIPEAQFARLSAYKVWIADYSKSARAIEVPAVPNNGHFQLWQFSESSLLTNGYKGNVDANVYYGTEEQFVGDFELK